MTVHLLTLTTLLLGTALSAQTWSHIPTYEQESMYREFRREKIPTKPKEYGLSGPVKKMTLTYTPAADEFYSANTEQYHFSENGLLTVYVQGDTVGIKDAKAYRYTAAWYLYYNAQMNLDTFRKREFSHGVPVPDEYMLVYDTAGYLVSSQILTNGSRSYLSMKKLTYVYVRRDTLISVKSSPHYDMDIEGNALCDSVHFHFNRDGEVVLEHIFRFGGEESLSFAPRGKGYSIDGRSYMQQSGARKYNAAGQLVVIKSSGYYIDQQGTFYTATEDSMVYNEKGLLVEVHKLPQTPHQPFATYYFETKSVASPEPTNEPRLRLELQYKYIYDAHGNWISREHYNGSGKLTGTETREIVYY
ncbi:MAG TPA: hypothetical protein VK826_05820 [Bacteroidia bacterium]|nr:hypothetical protein [Bacteroidia bacterium]